MKNELRNQLAALLSADDPALRRRAAEELAEIKGFTPIAALAAALRDENKGYAIPRSGPCRISEARTSLARQWNTSPTKILSPAISRPNCC